MEGSSIKVKEILDRDLAPQVTHVYMYNAKCWLDVHIKCILHLSFCWHLYVEMTSHCVSYKIALSIRIFDIPQKIRFKVKRMMDLN